MSKNPQSGPGSIENVAVPFERVAALVRQLTHDIRNGLNTLDLQASYLQELVTDPEALPEVKRIRTMVSGTAKMLQAFSSTFSLGEAHPVTYSAQIFVEDFRARLAAVLPESATEIGWTETLDQHAIAVDIELIFRAFSEFFKNAFHFREKGREEIAAHAFADGESFVIELRERKAALGSPPETWGREPLVSTRRGGFGMGLFHARRILAQHQGEVKFSFDPAAEVLTTRLSLPLAPPG
jgi:two-component system nitrogen regulation sensor histidine kinase NtrY